MARTGRRRLSAIALIALLVSIAAGCGATSPVAGSANRSTASTVPATPSTVVASPTATTPLSPARETALANALESDIQQVETAETAGNVAHAIAELTQDLDKAAAAPAAGDQSIASEWYQALNALSAALAGLRPLTGNGTQTSAQSPLQKSSSSANSVKDVIDELNTAYGLLEKVVKDVATIANYGSASPAPTSSTGTYTLTIINTNPADGTVTAPGIDCGLAKVQLSDCSASETNDGYYTIDFQGVTIGSTSYDVARIYPTPPACAYTPALPSPNAVCTVHGNANIVIAVTWQPSSP